MPTTAPPPSMPTNAPLHPSIRTPSSHDMLSPTEEALLSEYATLANNLSILSRKLSTLADTPTAAILDELRSLERKTSTVFTLLKASVYSIVLEGEVGATGLEEEEEQGEEI